MVRPFVWATDRRRITAEQPPDERTLAPYLLRHVSVTTPAGGAWAVQLAAVHASTYLDQPYFVADLTLQPPAGAPRAVSC
jgi:hypothetical protein